MEGLEENEDGEEEEEEEIYNHQKQQPQQQNRGQITPASVETYKKPTTPIKRGLVKLDNVFDQHNKGL